MFVTYFVHIVLDSFSVYYATNAGIFDAGLNYIFLSNSSLILSSHSS